MYRGLIVLSQLSPTMVYEQGEVSVRPPSLPRLDAVDTDVSVLAKLLLSSEGGTDNCYSPQYNKYMHVCLVEMLHTQ